MGAAFVLAVHGGAGTILRSSMTPEAEAAYRAGIRHALQAGYAVLSRGGSALDATVAAVTVLEDDPLFNAGRGSVYTTDRTQEMDAAVMDGETLNAGAVAGIFGPKNPVLAARAVMEQSEHVFLCGAGATEFCRQQKLVFESADYFFTQRRMEALEAELSARASGSDSDDPARKHGTVGAVACDARGHLAAATSTGGMTAKLPGRVGDSPVIGAGTYADDRGTAVSATGHGEYFIRYAVAHEINARLRLTQQPLAEICEEVVMKVLKEAGGSGGLIAVDAKRNVALPFNSEGMYRGVVREDGQCWTAIYQGSLISARFPE